MSSTSNVSTTGLRFSETAMTFANGTAALAGIDLAVRPGEFVSIVGPSGCGKSTLLRLASGLDKHTGGQVTVDQSHLGYVFQDPTLLPWRTVRDNVALFTELRGVAKPEARQRIAAALDLVGLAGFENHYPHQLSGGMRMRCSVARSLTLNPDVFLFDEPFGALDEISRQRLNTDLQELFHSQGFAALFVTHSISEAVYLSTDVVVMSGRPGRILDRIKVPFATPREPAIRYTDEFAHLCGQVSDVLSGTATAVAA